MVRAKDTLETIAHRFHISSKAVLLANNLTKHAVKSGKQLIIPTHLKNIAQNSQRAPTAKKIQSGDTIYMVRRGDTIVQIARKFQTTASLVRITNLIDNCNLTFGNYNLIDDCNLTFGN